MFGNGLPKDVKEYLKNNCEYTDEDIEAKKDWLKDKIEFIRKYGMCPVHIEFIKECDKLFKTVREPPKLLGDDEPEWKYGFFLALTKKYGSRANWTFSMAFREFLQNALDGAEEVGRSIDDVKIYTEDGSIVLENPSKKLLIKHLEIGGSEKPCWSRGRYGEGLDIASSWIVDTGGIIYIFSHDVAYKIAGAEGRLLVLIADIPHIGNKTVVRIFHSGAEQMKELVDKLLPDKTKVVYEVMMPNFMCPYKMPNSILERTEDKGKIYHRGMFVNYSQVAVGKESFYDYNLWWFDVSRDRANLANVYSFMGNIRDVYERALRDLYDKLEKKKWRYLDKSIENTKEYQLIKRILDECLTPHPTKLGTYFVFTGGYLEFDAFTDLSSASKKVIAYIIRNEVVKLVGVDKADKIGFIATDVSKERIRDYLYRGYVPISLSDVSPKIADWHSVDVILTMNELRDVKSVREVAFPMYEHEKKLGDLLLKYGPETIYLMNMIRNYTGVIVHAITAYFRKDFLKEMAFFAEFDRAKIDKETIAFFSHDDNKIYVGLDRLKDFADWHSDEAMFDIAFEEITHMTSGATDNTAEFEKALIENARKFALKMSDVLNRLNYAMSGNGLFIDTETQIKGLSELMVRLSPVGMAPDEVSNKIDKWRKMVTSERYYFYAKRTHRDFLDYGASKTTLPLTVGDWGEVIGLIVPSPIVVIAPIEEYSTKAIAFIFVQQSSHEDTTLSEGYFGYLATGRKGYLESLLSGVKETLKKGVTLLDDPLVAIVGIHKIEMFDLNGKKLMEVKY